MNKLISTAVLIQFLLLNYAGRMAFAGTMEEIKKVEEVAKPPIITIERPSVTYNSQSYSDPFRLRKKAVTPDQPATFQRPVEEIPLPSLTIQGIVSGGPIPQAIINNKIYKIGDTVEGVKIIDIQKDGIDVFFNSRQQKLPAPAAVSIKPANKEPTKGIIEGGSNEK